MERGRSVKEGEGLDGLDTTEGRGEGAHPEANRKLGETLGDPIHSLVSPGTAVPTDQEDENVKTRRDLGEEGTKG